MRKKKFNFYSTEYILYLLNHLQKFEVVQLWAALRLLVTFKSEYHRLFFSSKVHFLSSPPLFRGRRLSQFIMCLHQATTCPAPSRYPSSFWSLEDLVHLSDTSLSCTDIMCSNALGVGGTQGYCYLSISRENFQVLFA